MAGERCVEDPDAGLESEQREAPFRIGARREGALPEIVAARETKERFDPHIRVLDRIAALGRDAAGNTIEGLCGEDTEVTEDAENNRRYSAPCAHAPLCPCPRITIPGRAPVCRPLSSTTLPLTITVGMPIGY